MLEPGVRWTGVIGVRGVFLGALKVGWTSSGSMTAEARLVSAKINNAKVPTRVARSQVWSISSGVMFGFSAKNGSTYISPTKVVM